MGVPIHVDSKDKIPKREHWAIFKFSEHSTSTYESNDGSVTVIKYEAYLDRTAWLTEIGYLEKDRGYDKDDYAAVLIKPAKITAAVQVNEDLSISFQ